MSQVIATFAFLVGMFFLVQCKTKRIGDSAFYETTEKQKLLVTRREVCESRSGFWNKSREKCFRNDKVISILLANSCSPQCKDDQYCNDEGMCANFCLNDEILVRIDDEFSSCDPKPSSPLTN